MLEEELWMRRWMEAEAREERRQQQLREQQEEARIREQYLAKMRLQREQQEQEARAKELARKQALDAKVKALKEEADAKAREEFAARQRQMEQEARADLEKRTAAMETALMELEDALAAAMRQHWLAEEERQRQIAAERDQWRRFQEQEQAKLREATLLRRAAKAQQLEEDKRRKMEIHRLQKEQAAVQAAQKIQSAPVELVEDSKVELSDAANEDDNACRHPEETKSPDDSTALDSSPNCEIPSEIPNEIPSEIPNEVPNKIPVQPSETPSPRSPEELKVDDSHEPPSSIVNLWNRAILSTTTAQAQEDQTAKDSSQPSDQPSIRDDDESSVSEHSSSQTPNSSSAQLDLVTGDSNEHPTEECVQPRATWTVDTAREHGMLPFAQVQSVTGGSPAMEAALKTGDLLVNFGGITASTPKCLLSVGECVQSHIEQELAIIVLRAVPQISSTSSPELYEEHTMSLRPRKWQGKGLLGCQLSPFKWPDPDMVPSGETIGESTATDAVNSSTSALIVICNVAVGAMGAEIGLRDGDLLVYCGNLDLGSTEVATITKHIQECQEPVHLEVQRWLHDEQRYCQLNFDLPSRSGLSPIGFDITTYDQYYGIPTAVPTSAPCTDCYYSTTPSAVHTAALTGHTECLEALWLLSSREMSNDSNNSAYLDILEWKDDDGRSPLFYACYAAQVESVRFLTSHLARFNVEIGADLYGDTPLHAAVMVGCDDILRLLLDSQFIDVNVSNTAQQTGAHVAPTVAVLQLLEQFDADMLATDNEGRMPLLYACLRNDLASVEYLCSKYPDFVDYADVHGNTPLHLSAWLGLDAVVSVLVQFLPAIALHLTNLEGNTPVELARANGMDSVAQFLDQAMGCML